MNGSAMLFSQLQQIVPAMNAIQLAAFLDWLFERFPLSVHTKVLAVNRSSSLQESYSGAASETIDLRPYFGMPLLLVGYSESLDTLVLRMRIYEQPTQG